MELNLRYSSLFLFFTILTSTFNLQAQKERDPSKIAFVNLENLIRTRVEQSMSNWLLQGEFEKTADYQERIKTQDGKITEFTEEAIDFYMQKHINKIDFSTCDIVGKYDPDAETFRIHCNRIGDFILPVPLEEAPMFKESGHRLTFSNPQFVIRDNAWVMSYLEVGHHGKSFAYDISQNVTYNPNDDFAVNTEDLDIQLPNSRQINQPFSFGNNTYENIDAEYNITDRLPFTGMKNNDGIAVVIGNRNYQQTKWVEFASNDALMMKRYLVEVLGFKPGNVFVVKNATKGTFDTYFGTATNHKGKVFDAVKAGKSDLFVFYSGHGAPGLNDKSGYFVPVECNPNRVELGGYSLELFYKNLAKIPARSTTVVIDACFSGAEILENISPIGIRSNLFSSNKIVSFTSSTGTQVSSWYNARQHGLFTYFFLKALHDKTNSDRNQDGQLTYQEIQDYISDQNEGLPYFARRLHGLEQTPTLQGGDPAQVLVKY